MSWENERSVKCPKCGANKKEHCKSKTGKYAKPHGIRIVLANYERQSNQYLNKINMLREVERALGNFLYGNYVDMTALLKKVKAENKRP